MKNKTLCLSKGLSLPVIFLIAVLWITYQSYSMMAASVFGFAVNQKTILIDAGHGGWERGGCS